MAGKPGLTILTLFASSLFAPAVGLADTSGNDTQSAERTSISSTMTRAERDRGEHAPPTQFDYPALVTGATQSADSKTVLQMESNSGAARATDFDFWFYTADVILFNDRDGDGFYHGIDLLFDADTIYEYAEVYAVAYLSLEGGPWNEYTVTDTFSIAGTDAEDEYAIVTELVSGYPTGSYDLLIELFDAVDGSFLASYGPADTSALGLLALEDAGRDPMPVTTTVIVREGGGGSLGWLTLSGLLLLAVVRFSRRGSPAP